jgi:hypothetical protein
MQSLQTLSVPTSVEGPEEAPAGMPAIEPELSRSS